MVSAALVKTMVAAGIRAPVASLQTGAKSGHVRLNPSLSYSVRGGLQVEEKSKDNVHNFAVNFADLFTPLAAGNMDQGQTIVTRIGLQVVVRSIELSYTFTMAQLVGGVTDTNLVRVLLFVDHQSNGTVPVVEDDILEANSVNSPMRVGKMHRFTILMDKLITLTAPGLAWNGTDSTSSAVKAQLQYTWRGAIPITYSGTGGGNGDVRKNNIFFFPFFHNATPVNCKGVLRIRFTDM